ncbi:MAG: hypothetical protein EOP88_01400 [Verrucomicrobiaceae bacterium]|nr:MAG: hypothetical protein EOP88_01400 [Verrucomicrobiaceae bacterium]
MKTSHCIASILLIPAVVAVSMKGTSEKETAPVGNNVEKTRIREAPFRMTVSGEDLTDPAAALHSISLLPDGDRLPSQMHLVEAWARHDFSAAREWVLSATTSRTDLLLALGRGGIASRPQDVMALADELSTEQERVAFFTTLVQEWANSDPAAATAWVEECTLPEKASIQTALVTQLAQDDPSQAATYVAVSMEPGFSQDQAALTVAARWTSLDPAAASAWARSLPESDLQQRVLAAVTSLSRP